jgi:gliding motility-associated-like protein
VVGADAVGCFTDTATIDLVVHARPSVNAGPDIETTATETVNLRATGSADVVSYLWQPASFLSCTNCPNPQSKPLTPITYTVTVRNDKNCAATDTLNIRLLCGEAFYIPNSFTPNNDGKNDRFYVLGGGATVKHFRIFNRWGTLVFEAKNVFTNDRNGGWDGNFNGQPVATGTYVYMAQVECFNGTVFEYKGTVTLIR